MSHMPKLAAGPTFLDYLTTHWIGWLVFGVGAVVSWFGLNWLASPVLTFLDDRRHAIEAVQEHGSIGWFPSEQAATAARSALGTAARRMLFYAQGGPGIVRLYCKMRGYDLQLAGRALNGLASNVGSPMPEYQCDAVRVCLGAARLISASRGRAILKVLRNEVQQGESRGERTRS